MIEELPIPEKQLATFVHPTAYVAPNVKLGPGCVIMPMVDNIGYTGPSKLMDNYGWVQNTSNLSTVRETVDLIPEEGIDHNT